MADIDLSFRPVSYWTPTNVRQAILPNIRGESRRRLVDAAAAEGALSSVPDELLADKLSDDDRQALARVDLSFLGGEFLPDTKPGEVEIARIVFASAGQDVISIRARRQPPRIRYRVVDEHERTFRCAPQTSTQPLTLGELVNLIDSCELVDEGRGLVSYFLDSLITNPDANTAENRRGLQDFITVESEFYSMLRQHYEQRLERWAQTGSWV